ncbi:MAG: FtsX-like permease family protein [Spirochaetales bacterium]|nr:FtsX-like permease family protein [Spirochaetales bacterium]
MFNEPVKIILRRFRDRSLESGLLIIAVALGIGAFSAGLSLIMNTIKFSNEIMSSPEYKELVVSTRSNANEMDVPVKEKLVNETAVLTSEDLEAANLAPDVEWAYVQNHSMLMLISADSSSNNFGPPGGMGAPQGGMGGPQGGGPDNGQAPPDGMDNNQDEQGGPGGPDFHRMSEEEIAEAKADADIILSDLERVSGFEVTPQFFNSWNIEAAEGSLFSTSDLRGTDNIIVLGSEFAKLLAGDDMKVSDLLGKKLLARGGYQTIVGILNPVSEEYDSKFFKPYREDNGGMRGLRRGFMDTRLRFAVEDPEQLDSTETQLQNWFTSQFGDAQIVISNPRAEAEQLVARNTGIGILILFLSAAGFFIALVNVSNILMSRVLRMKKNVGILMALGASRKDIRNLFLSESLLLAVSGGIAGVILAVPLSNYMETAAGITSGSWLFIAAGAIIAGVLTFVFGLIPARQFMKIDPAIAMRSVS